ncbi:hypothetical protein BX600DRAFT_153015 [Xylariales sp. PMI_506]|nr:hypothetical protein BX600DRAFT_153015 [Xylariales sp. PMI_506]
MDHGSITGKWFRYLCVWSTCSALLTTRFSPDIDPTLLSRIDDAHPALLFIDSQTSLQQSSLLGSAMLTAQLSGTFLQASQSIPPARGQIYCYRRNLFQIRGTIMLRDRDGGPSLGPSTSEARHILVTLSATESINGDTVAIITVPKSGKEVTTATGPTSSAPNDIKADICREYGSPIPFSWSRLQFRSATAKGGRRKGRNSEQHFTIHLHLYTVFADGSRMRLAENRSAPIVVRGRSPGNFSATKPCNDNPEHINSNPRPDGSTLDQDAHSTAVHLDPASWMANSPTGDFANHENEALFDSFVLETGTDSQIVGDEDLLAGNFYTLDDELPNSPGLNFQEDGFIDASLPANFAYWGPTQHSQTPASLDTAASNIAPPASFSGGLASRQHSWAEEDTTLPSVETTKKSFSYEYISLGADDRTPPVQAVYQPHGVHHKLILPKTRQCNNKRYFGELSE